MDATHDHLPGAPRRDGAPPDADLLLRVMALWDTGRDTCDIARLLSVHESVAARALALGRERRLAQRSGSHAATVALAP
jgi:hypothetical protein